jgi:hypothetical protein
MEEGHQDKFVVEMLDEAKRDLCRGFPARAIRPFIHFTFEAGLCSPLYHFATSPLQSFTGNDS